VTAGSGPIQAGTIVQPLQSVKPIAIVRVHWLWTVLRSVILARYSSLVLLLSPELVSPALAVEMWG
jgi:hypothetical protein